MRLVLKWFPVVFGLALLSLVAAAHGHRYLQGKNDFVTLYSGGRLAGTPGLYSAEANEAIERPIIGGTMRITYIRPPFYAVLLKPLTSLPYLAAYGVFCALCLACVVWFVIRFSRECPELPAYASCSIPAAAFFLQGQDTAFLLALTGAAILLTRRKRDFLCGVVLSLCAIKFHLFLFLVPLLLMKKRWRTVAGGACGAVILFLTGVVFAGADSGRQYLRLLRDPGMEFDTAFMPNIHGFAATLHAGAALELGLMGAVVLAFLWICHRSGDYEWLFALSLLCGLLASYHSGVGDDVLLLPVFVLMVPSGSKLLRIALAITVSPVPWFVGLPYSVTMPPLLFFVLVLAVISVARRRVAVEPCPAVG